MRNLILSLPGDLEVKLWLGLSLLEEDPHKSMVAKLKHIKATSPEQLPPYLEYSNKLLEWDIHRPGLVNLLLDALVNSEPSLDKIEDCLKLKNESSNLEHEKVLVLEDFLDSCRKVLNVDPNSI